MLPTLTRHVLRIQTNCVNSMLENRDFGTGDKQLHVTADSNADIDVNVRELRLALELLDPFECSHRVHLKVLPESEDKSGGSSRQYLLRHLLPHSKLYLGLFMAVWQFLRAGQCRFQNWLKG